MYLPLTNCQIVYTCMWSLSGHHCCDRETVDNILILPEVQSNNIVFKWLCKVVMALRVDLLYKITKMVTTMYRVTHVC